MKSGVLVAKGGECSPHKMLSFLIRACLLRLGCFPVEKMQLYGNDGDLVQFLLKNDGHISK